MIQTAASRHAAFWLHEALKPSAGQQRAWEAYQSAVKPQPRTAPAERPQMATLSAPERMQRRIDAGKLRLARMEAHAPDPRRPARAAGIFIFATNSALIACVRNKLVYP